MVGEGGHKDTRDRSEGNGRPRFEFYTVTVGGSGRHVIYYINYEVSIMLKRECYTEKTLVNVIYSLYNVIIVLLMI